MKPLTLLLLASILLAPGCGGAERESRKRVWTEGQSIGILQTALRAELPDDRRRAVERIGRSPYVGTPESLRTMDVVVRTDSSQLVRAAAARCLAASADPAAYGPLLTVIEAQGNAQRVVPAGSHLLATILEAMTELSAQHVLCPQPERLVESTSVLLAGYIEDNQVRVDAARLLSHYPSRRTLDAFVDVLDQDFAVAYEARHALEMLTGQGFGTDQQAWRKWLDEQGDPLAWSRTADQPEPQRGWWGRMFGGP